jgi:hypothetical protein
LWLASGCPAVGRSGSFPSPGRGDPGPRRRTPISTSNRADTTRRVLGSLAVIGTAAAVAGRGTFGTSTDSTTPVPAQLTSGTVSIDLAEPAAPIPAVTTGLLPGDSIARTLTLVNDGNSPLSSVALGVSTTNPSATTCCSP